MRLIFTRTAAVLSAGLLSLIVYLSPVALPALAAGDGGDEHATGWQGGERAQLRLIAGQASWLGQQRLLAGIEIKLAPKWKTYWRNPGDTGIPPEFDFKGSTNLKKAEVLYPFPERFRDPGGLAIGYQARVIFPVLLEAVDPSQPIGLRLSANYAICYDLCIPLSARQALMVRPAVAGPYGPALSLSLADVPKPLRAGGAVGVARVEFLNGDNGGEALQIAVTLPDRPGEVDLFVEAEDGLYVPDPKRVEAGGAALDVAAFRIDLAGVDKPEKFTSVHLTCTLRIGDDVIVQPCDVR